MVVIITKQIKFVSANTRLLYDVLPDTPVEIIGETANGDKLGRLLTRNDIVGPVKEGNYKMY